MKGPEERRVSVSGIDIGKKSSIDCVYRHSHAVVYIGPCIVVIVEE